MKKLVRYITFYSFLLLTFFFSCKSKNEELLELEEYTGPILEVEDVLTLYTDSARLKTRLEAPLEYDYVNGDREFPKGLYLEFYDYDGKLLSTLKTNYCYYQFKEDVYKATGNVVIEGKEADEKLNTEELFWNLKEERVYTDKFVRIEKDGEIHKGDGLEAKQDFSEYTILNSTGTIDLDEEPEAENDE